MPGSDEYHAELVSRLEKSWNTFYGVAMVVNALLNLDLATTRISKTKPFLYGFWAAFLFFSPFGEAITALHCAGEPE
eukprot:2360260-Pyramimonas_sp.AAC.1